MIWTYRGRKIPLEIYHGVPKGWYANEIAAEHARLGGTFSIAGPEATEPGAPSWMPERNAWLQYRGTLYRVGDGIAFGDPACVELAIRYIELRYIGSYSGFVRALFSRRLKHVVLSDSQRIRLHRHFAALVLNDERTDEFRDYVKLWRRIVTDKELEDFLGVLRAQPDGERRAQELEALLRPGTAVSRTRRCGT